MNERHCLKKGVSEGTSRLRPLWSSSLWVSLCFTRARAHSQHMAAMRHQEMDQCANNTVRKKASSREECEQFNTENIYRSDFANVLHGCLNCTTLILHLPYHLMFTFRASSVKSGPTGILFGGVVFLIMATITANLETGLLKDMPRHVSVEDLFSYRLPLWSIIGERCSEVTGSSGSLIREQHLVCNQCCHKINHAEMHWVCLAGLVCGLARLAG